MRPRVSIRGRPSVRWSVRPSVSMKNDLLQFRQCWTRKKEGQGRTRNEEAGATTSVKKVVKRMKNEKVARGRIIDPRGLDLIFFFRFDFFAPPLTLERDRIVWIFIFLSFCCNFVTIRNIDQNGLHCNTNCFFFLKIFQIRWSFRRLH